MGVNIGSIAFTIDYDAYELLREYLDDIAGRLPSDERDEVTDDVEARVADILGGEMTVAGQVVNIAMVRKAIAIIGRAECFGERRSCPPPASAPAKRDKLYRSRNNKVIGGLCGGIAEYMDWDASVVRLITVILVFFGGLSLWVYIILWVAVPIEPYDNYRDSYRTGKNDWR